MCSKVQDLEHPKKNSENQIVVKNRTPNFNLASPKI